MFEGYANDIRSRAKSDLVVYGPITNNATAWKNFSIASSHWIEESVTIFAELEPGSDLPVGAPLEPNDGVIKMKEPSGNFVPATPVDGKFLPLLHYSPPLSQLGAYQNFDLYSSQEMYTAAAAAATAGGKLVARSVIDEKKIALTFVFYQELLFRHSDRFWPSFPRTSMTRNTSVALRYIPFTRR